MQGQNIYFFYIFIHLAVCVALVCEKEEEKYEVEVVRGSPAEGSSSVGKPPKHIEGREGSVAAVSALITAAHNSSVLFVRSESVHNTSNLTGSPVCVT